MSALLTTLPGDIPGLIRRGSPVLYTEALIPGVALALIAEELGEFSDPPILSVALFGQHVIEDRCVDIVWRDRHHLHLDLTDVTGRAHAAAWAYHHPAIQGFTGLSRDEHAAMETALHCDPMTPEQIDALARLVLRLAGRTP